MVYPPLDKDGNDFDVNIIPQHDAFHEQENLEEFQALLEHYVRLKVARIP